MEEQLGPQQRLLWGSGLGCLREGHGCEEQSLWPLGREAAGFRAVCPHECHPHPAVTAGCSLPTSSRGTTGSHPLLQASHLQEEAWRGQAADGKWDRESRDGNLGRWREANPKSLGVGTGLVSVPGCDTEQEAVVGDSPSAQQWHLHLVV